MAKTKQTKEKAKEKTYALTFTETEMKNHIIKRAIVNLVIVKAGLYRTQPFFAVSKAEAEVMPMVPLFTPIAKYGKGKFPNEIGKLRGKCVCLK